MHSYYQITVFMLYGILARYFETKLPIILLDYLKIRNMQLN